jgi:WD repeat-containing protein 48
MYVDQRQRSPTMLINHMQVQDKLYKFQSGSKTELVRSSVDSQGLVQVGSQSPADDLYEILCNDTLLPYEMTLAAVRQFVWRQGTELVMYYRRKRITGPG